MRMTAEERKQAASAEMQLRLVMSGIATGSATEKREQARRMTAKERKQIVTTHMSNRSRGKKRNAQVMSTNGTHWQAKHIAKRAKAAEGYTTLMMRLRPGTERFSPWISSVDSHSLAQLLDQTYNIRELKLLCIANGIMSERDKAQLATRLADEFCFNAWDHAWLADVQQPIDEQTVPTHLRMNMPFTWVRSSP
jgi:hypothetical protein